MTMRRYATGVCAAVFAVVLIGAGRVHAQTASACSAISLGNEGSLNGFMPFPSTNAWNTDVTSAAIDSNSASIISTLAGNHLHPDFSSVSGGNYGIPYVVVNSNSTPMVPVKMTMYPDESDIVYYPLPANAPVEGETNNCSTDDSDRHVIVIDTKTCFAYELWQGSYCNGQWSASNGAIWDLQNYEQRPITWTSVDAAGLPVFPGLVRYDEVASGAINHAIRFTLQHTKTGSNGSYFVNPATHGAGDLYGTSNVMGMRLRLKANFDISGYPKDDQVILTAMKKYGLILADNGSNMFFQGTPDARWNDDDLNLLKNVDASNFDVIQMTPAFPGNSSDNPPTGAAPTINSFSASPATVAAGGAATLSWSISNDSYDFIDVLGGMRGTSVTVNPTKTTTYTLEATNAYGRTTKAVTVTVSGSGTGTTPTSTPNPTPTSTVSRPVINSFSAAPVLVGAGGAATLSWNVSNAVSVAITPGTFTSAAGTGSFSVNPSANTTYVLTATGSGGSVSSSLIVSVDATAPITPGSVSATANSTSTATVTWAASTDTGGAGLSGYYVYRCSGASCVPQTKIATTASLSYRDSGLAPSTVYRYDVAAYDGAGNISPASTVVEVTTLALPSGTPTPTSTPNPTSTPTLPPVVVPPVTPSSTPTSTPGSTGNAAIGQLLTQFLALQHQLNHMLVSQFTRNLSVGSTGTDVQYLQMFLNLNGYRISAQSAGSLGNESTYFGYRTAQALRKLQSAYGLSATGVLDAATRAFLQKTF